MAVTGLLAQAQRAIAERSWLEAREAFARADGSAPLDAEDLELWAIAELMLAQDEAAVATLERAHYRYLERGETVRAVRPAIWIGMNLAYGGAVGPASGWLGRAQRLLDQEPGESADHGYLLLPLVFRHEAAGEYEEAAAVAGRAAAVGQRFGDRDLLALAVHAQGHMLVMSGQVRAGMALLDEAMVTVTTDEPMPFVVGIVYCGVILACQSVFEVGRAREWTQVLTAWVEGQRDLVAFTGRCLVHRAEILQLGGAWPDALNEARLAGQRFVETGNPAAGLAHYRQGELLRLLGRFDPAEAAYRDASRMGGSRSRAWRSCDWPRGGSIWPSSPSGGRAPRSPSPSKRAALLPAHVEIALAAGEVDDARSGVRRVALPRRTVREPDAHRHGRPRRRCHCAGRRRRAAARSRTCGPAQQLWIKLDAPYEVARARALLSAACAALGRQRGRSARARGSLRGVPQAGSCPGSRTTRAGAGQARARTLWARARGAAACSRRGKTNREIAAVLVISEHTVARHVQNIYAKLRVASRAAATAFAFEHDLV